jgi:hypothetical protein
MARTLKKSKTAKLLTISPEATKLDSFTATLRGRTAVYRHNGVEVASLFDLINLSVAGYRKVSGKRGSKCLIKEWHQIARGAFGSLRMGETRQHLLSHDDGVANIVKFSSYETFFIAIEDFPKYLDLVAAEQKLVGKWLHQGWTAMCAGQGAGGWNF